MLYINSSVDGFRYLVTYSVNGSFVFGMFCLNNNGVLSQVKVCVDRFANYSIIYTRIDKHLGDPYPDNRTFFRTITDVLFKWTSHTGIESRYVVPLYRVV